MKRLLLIATLLSSSPAYALDSCAPVADDPQIRTCAYSPTQRYAINAPVGFPVNLTFGETERIKRYDFAYSGVGVGSDGKSPVPASTWVGPKGKGDTPTAEGRYMTNLPVWPMQAGHSALIVVTQTEDGKERTYQFDLTATTEPNPNTTSALRFTYKAEADVATLKVTAEKRQNAVNVWRQQQAKKSEDEAVARLKTDPFYGVRNWAYRAKADPKYKMLEPREVSDNGWLTEFQWPGNVQAPTISIMDPATGEERIIVPSQTGDMYIVNTTAATFRLRLGHDAVMDVQNLHWSPERPDPKTGTTSPDAVRVITYADKK
jgi:type IV secretory pathway VirB9-like protein